jgi:hypothetical protein
MQQSASSAQLAKDTPVCDSGRGATTCTTGGIDGWTIGSGELPEAKLSRAAASHCYPRPSKICLAYASVR